MSTTFKQLIKLAQATNKDAEVARIASEQLAVTLLNHIRTNGNANVFTSVLKRTTCHTVKSVMNTKVKPIILQVYQLDKKEGFSKIVKCEEIPFIKNYDDILTLIKMIKKAKREENKLRKEIQAEAEAKTTIADSSGNPKDAVLKILNLGGNSLTLEDLASIQAMVDSLMEHQRSVELKAAA